MRKTIAAVGAVLMLSIGGPAQAWSLFPPQPTVGKPAPKFTATLFSGGKVSLDDYRGQVLVVNVWATWCGPCRQELPLLNAFYKATEKHGLRMIAVTSEGSVPDRQLKPLAAALSFPLAHEVRGPYGDLGAIPTNYVIDRAGVVRYAAAGAFDLDQLNSVLIPLLQEPPPPDAPPSTPAAGLQPAAAETGQTPKPLP
jgi:cytochrome c biogenesis protein CcmG, thiol:disulfide interchange protein DsbE